MQMGRRPAARWMRAGVGMYCAAVPLAVVAIGFRAAKGPGAILWTFLLLAIACALAGFVLLLIGARKVRAENQLIVVEARARAVRDRASRGK